MNKCLINLLLYSWNVRLGSKDSFDFLRDSFWWQIWDQTRWKVERRHWPTLHFPPESRAAGGQWPERPPEEKIRPRRSQRKRGMATLAGGQDRGGAGVPAGGREGGGGGKGQTRPKLSSTCCCNLSTLGSLRPTWQTGKTWQTNFCRCDKNFSSKKCTVAPPWLLSFSRRNKQEIEII